MEPRSQVSRHCGVCQKEVIDFTKSTRAYFDNQVQQHGENLCGRFEANEQGEILFKTTGLSKLRRALFIFALSICFHSTLFSNVPISWVNVYQQQLKEAIPPEETVTLYGIVRVGRERLTSVGVKITINGTYIIDAWTDERGRFSFDVKPTMLIETIAFEADSRSAVQFIVNEQAEIASKRIYKIQYRARTFTGCPSF
jgi:hypothetical protein